MNEEMTEKELQEWWVNRRKQKKQHKAIIKLFNETKKPRPNQFRVYLQSEGCNEEETEEAIHLYYQLTYALVNNLPYNIAGYETAEEPENGAFSGTLPHNYK